MGQPADGKDGGSEMTKQRLVLSFNIVLWLALAITHEARAWFSLDEGGDTHYHITKDALSDASITKDEYPDLLRFGEQLRDGSNTESHNIPDGNQTQWWMPASTNWFTAGRFSDDDEGALSRYGKFDFANAYKRMGFELHLVQDERVPAHKKFCVHGRRLSTEMDGLEAMAAIPGKYNYGPPVPEANWSYQFTHTDGKTTFRYWLSDSEDDDDEDDIPFGDSNGDSGDENGGSGPDIPDGPDGYCGVEKTKWGTYGRPEYILTPLAKFKLKELWPGLDKGKDHFAVAGNIAILRGQLQLAKNDTLARMKQRSKELPPIVPDSGTNPFLSLKIFGPNKPVDIAFEAMENRRQTVYVSILAGSAGIRDRNTGKVWDGSSTADYNLQEDKDLSALPWKGTVKCSWKGELGNGNLADDGIYVITMKVKDHDDKSSDARTRTVTFDKTKPISKPVVVSLVSYP
jgi:hypothetical protein